MAQVTSFREQMLRDTRGNVMYMTAGLLLPIMATIGAGVDLGQAYMAKSRLQQACDAGVLAGRRSMAEGTFGSDDAAAARRMFNFNYQSGQYGSTGITFTPVLQGTNEVAGTATATVPTLLMRIFGNNAVAMSVNCTAKLEISNVDIMFVLDTTGSMAQTNAGDSVSRIAALRTEVMAFFDTVAAAQSGTSQIRYGVVPYSSNVNVGRILYAANPTWISSNLTVPSRTGAWVVTGNTGPTTAWTDFSGFTTWTSTGATIGGQTSSTCPNVIPAPQYVDGTLVFGPSTTTSTSGTSPETTTTNVDNRYNSTKYRYAWVSSACRLQSSPGVRQQRATSTQTREYRYSHSSISYDVSGVLNGSGLTRPLGTLGANVTAVWNGCIMERDTVAFDDAVTTIPAGTWDLDVDTPPSNEATRWEVALPNFVFPRDPSPWNTQSPSPATMVTTTDIGSYAGSTAVNGGYSACPTEAMRLTPMTSANRSTLQNYVNSLVAVGGTYHDIGMLWGTRFISPSGIFASSNAAAPNGAPISRHIIFMTDGDMAPNPGIYGFQGQEFLQGRVGSTSTTELTLRHNRRFNEACSAAKSRNITVWVISFGTALNSSMSACASGDKAYQANNSAQLRTQFQNIASQITRLRLSQ